ncbi:MAG: ChaN family lipoprotein [Dissulfuribacterales bacterium]
MKKSPYFLSLFLFILAFLASFGTPARSEAGGENIDNIPIVRVNVILDVENRLIKGGISAQLPMGKTIRIHTGGVDLGRITLAGRTINPSIEEDSFTVAASGGNRLLRIQFHRNFRPSGSGPGGKNGYFVMDNFIDAGGVVLLDGWCPMLEGLALYELRAAIPAGFKAVSEADAIKVQSREDTSIYIFEFPHPRTGLSLVAAPYQVNLERHKGIEIAAYFFPDDKELARKYIDKAKYYLDLYEDILGAYPFKRFAIVENRAPTGYGLPTYTLLGQEVARLPFIVDTSLGHEILHSWFGNSVYVDPREGNWSEGLTTYLADHLYKEQKGLGRDYRHRLLADYQSYVHKDRAMPLSGFRFRTDRPSKAIGYGKGAMLFHMLKQEIGKDAFYKALKKFVMDYRFRTAGWSELKAVFSDIGKKDLSVFFDQWLERKDVPILSIKKEGITYPGSGHQGLKVTVRQGTESPYSLSVPLVLETTFGEVRRNVRVEHEKESMEIEIKGQPLSVTLDPDYDLMRSLEPSEFPPVLSRLLGSEHKFFVLPLQNPEVYCQFAVFLRSLGFKEKSIDSLMTGSDLNKGSLLILGDPAPRLERLTGAMPDPGSGVIITVRENPINPAGVVAVVKADSSRQLDLILKKLPHYGYYSTLRFEDGKLVRKDTAGTRNGIRLVLQTEVMGTAASDLSPIDRIINDISEKQVIYIGECHDNFSHHMAQLRIIQGLDRLDHPLAVGMEMFQRPFQHVLDRYLKGQIDEKTFLKESKYLERWRYDYQLYRPIIQYCREHDIPVLALNLPEEISKKVARKGLESLSDEELRQVPEDLDWSNTAYKTRLRRIFEKHPESGVRDFNDFYQAQILWDETMAQNVHDYMKNNPGRQIVVLAGNGHIAFGDGIPSRTYRRGKYDQAIIANVTGNKPEQGMADFFLFPPMMQPPFSARLGVILDEEDNGVVLKKVMRNSPAQKSGLKSGDLLLSFDGEPVKDISGLKLALLFKKEGDTAVIEVKRKKRFARDKILKFTAGPFKPMEMTFHHPRKVKK